ncbi:MAG: hypothetical protein HYZ34_05590, partial [Ignavibacteriae bacterium]|nr:hypothetical protein [Ignavibacteriota bacterium]
SVFSYESKIKYDTTTLQFVSIVKTGTLSGDASIVSNRKNDTLLFAAGGTSPMIGSGDLVRIRFTTASSAVCGSQSPLEFVHFQFNEGTPAAVLTNGSVQLCNRLTIQTEIHNGWNLLSLPLTVGDGKISTLFGNGLNAFVYTSSGYIPVDSVENGTGFWIKLSTDTGTTYLGIEGTERTTDTITVSEGWNLIGSISDTVQSNMIVQIPDSNIVSDYFRFDGSYIQSNSIAPMKGYWVKVKSDGVLLLSSTELTRAGRSQKVLSPINSVTNTNR